ncbi:MAG: phosphoribosylanthranilate isomerase [Ignavibacteria bacterium]|nr:phosphoribosylanthranilate isomerase [Ignavibacteria bacterium]
MQKKVKIKICCIQSVEEAELAIKYGASSIGLVSEMPSGPGVISEGSIIEIAEQVPADINTFLLTSKTDADEIITQHRKCKTTHIQLVDSVATDVYKKIRDGCSSVKIVQVIHITDEESISEAFSASNFVDVLLLDSGNQKLAVKELGGTGRTHDWSISKKIVESTNIPVFLAGGLNSSNVSAAVNEVNPYGVDLCNGIRINGNLDESLLKEFLFKL